MGRVVVDVKDFSFKYRQTKHKALKNVSFQVEEGSFFCIIGSNGSGKSTLCNALVGLMERVARCADKVMVLDAGEVVAIDEPKKIFGNPDIVAHHIGVPDYVKICNALKEKGYTDREIEVTEEPTIELVKEALKG